MQSQSMTETLQEDIKKRHRLMKDIESDTLEILDLYREVEELVKWQKEPLDAADNFVDQARHLVTDGLPQLEVAEGYQEGIKKKQCCLMGIMIICALFLVLFLYFSIS